LVVVVIFMIDLIKMELVKTIHEDKVSIVREIELYGKSKIVSSNDDHQFSVV